MCAQCQSISTSWLENQLVCPNSTRFFASCICCYLLFLRNLPFLWFWEIFQGDGLRFRRLRPQALLLSRRGETYWLFFWHQHNYHDHHCHHHHHHLHYLTHHHHQHHHYHLVSSLLVISTIINMIAIITTNIHITITNIISFISQHHCVQVPSACLDWCRGEPVQSEELCALSYRFWSCNNNQTNHVIIMIMTIMTGSVRGALCSILQVLIMQ